MSSEQQERAIRGAAGAALRNEQKRDICMLASKVWAMIGKPGFADQAADLPKAFRLSEAEASEMWRQNEQRAACGTLHLTAARQDQYTVLMSHFRALECRALAARGKMAAARDAGREAGFWAKRGMGDDRRRAQAVLDRELVGVADVIERPTDYAQTIAGCKFKARLEALSPKQIWTIVFDIRRAAQKRRKKS